MCGLKDFHTWKYHYYVCCPDIYHTIYCDKCNSKYPTHCAWCNRDGEFGLVFTVL